MKFLSPPHSSCGLEGPAGKKCGKRFVCLCVSLVFCLISILRFSWTRVGLAAVVGMQNVLNVSKQQRRAWARRIFMLVVRRARKRLSVRLYRWHNFPHYDTRDNQADVYSISFEAVAPKVLQYRCSRKGKMSAQYSKGKDQEESLTWGRASHTSNYSAVERGRPVINNTLHYVNKHPDDASTASKCTVYGYINSSSIFALHYEYRRKISPSAWNNRLP